METIKVTGIFIAIGIALIVGVYGLHLRASMLPAILFIGWLIKITSPGLFMTGKDLSAKQ